MEPLDLALKYMEIFFSGRDIGELRPLLSKDFSFQGPFYTFTTAEDYITSLSADPPKDFEYEIIQTFENESHACLVFQFSKPGVSTPMAQLFRISEGKICRILLVFDTGVFT